MRDAASRPPRRTFGTHVGRPVGLTGLVDRMPTLSPRSIHAVAPSAPDDQLVWECLAACSFVGTHEQAIAHAIANQFDLVTR